MPEECRFLLNTQLVFLKKEKDPTANLFDDDEWIRSLTEAQEVTADVPKESVTYDQQAVDPKKVSPIQVGEFLREICLQASLSTERRRNCSPHDGNALTWRRLSQALRPSPSSMND